VYRNGERIASSVQGGSYDDTNPPVGTDVSYTVSAIYKNSSVLESTLSETTVNTGYTGLQSINRNLLAVSLQDEVIRLHNKADEPAILSIYSVTGDLLSKVSLKQGETLSVPGLNHGVYIVKASYATYGDLIKKVIR
jgi:hypothetical protein